MTPGDLKCEADALLIQHLKKKTTEGGIVLPEMDKRSRLVAVGRVLSCGEGKMLPSGQIQPMIAKEGDLVMFSGQAGLQLGDEMAMAFELSHEETKGILFMRQADILAVVNDAELEKKVLANI